LEKYIVLLARVTIIKL